MRKEACEEERERREAPGSFLQKPEQGRLSKQAGRGIAVSTGLFHSVV